MSLCCFSHVGNCIHAQAFLFVATQSCNDWTMKQTMAHSSGGWWRGSTILSKEPVSSVISKLDGWSFSVLAGCPLCFVFKASCVACLQPDGKLQGPCYPSPPPRTELAVTGLSQLPGNGKGLLGGVWMLSQAGLKSRPGLVTS